MGVKVYSGGFTFGTTKKRELVNITQRVQEQVDKAKMKNGLVLVFAPHATAAIMVDEDESGLKQDVLDTLWRLIPEEGHYLHDTTDRNSHAHQKASIIGCSRVIPVIKGALGLGTWQSIFFLESDGPRSTRKVTVTVIGE